MKRLIAATAFALATASTGASAALLLNEGFDTFLPAGWTVINNSAPVGSTSWFAGNTSVFGAQAGAAGSYAAANFNSAGFGGNASTWLLSPEIAIANGETITFYTRTELDAFPGDNLELRFSTNASSVNVGATATSVGDFGNLLLTVASATYPQGWTQFTATISGLGAATTGRIAFRYVVTDTSVNGDYVGVDTVAVNSGATTVPEPATLALLGLSLAAAGFSARRAKRS